MFSLAKSILVRRWSVYQSRLSGEKGSALAIVLFPLAAAALIAANLAAAARTEVLINRNVEHALLRRLAEEAVLNRTIVRLLTNNPTDWPIPDGRGVMQRFDQTIVHVAVMREAAKINLNAASNVALINLITQSCTDRGSAERIGDAIADYVDEDDARRAHGMEKVAYEAAGLPYGPRNERLKTLDELRRVPGVSEELFRRIRPYVTVYSYAEAPELGLADPATIAAVLNVDRTTAERQRQAAPQAGLAGGATFAGIVTLSAWIETDGRAEPGISQTLYFTGDPTRPVLLLDRQQDVAIQSQETSCATG